MRTLKRLFENNRRWVEQVNSRDPGFFARLAQEQRPEILWISCSDSRVPANQIVDVMPGELFVHRNVGNVVVPSDLNCLSVLEFGVAVLKVRHVIVCGHYGCGAVGAAMSGERIGLAANWIGHIVNVKEKHAALFSALEDGVRRADLLCELNVLEQSAHVCRSTVVLDAWARGVELSVHSWIYDVRDGLLRDLGMCVNAPDELAAVYERALSALQSGG